MTDPRVLRFALGAIALSALLFIAAGALAAQ